MDKNCKNSIRYNIIFRYREIKQQNLQRTTSKFMPDISQHFYLDYANINNLHERKGVKNESKRVTAFPNNVIEYNSNYNFKLIE